MIYPKLTNEVAGFRSYIERTTFWGAGALLGGAGYLTTNVKQLPMTGKLILFAAAVLFAGSLVFSILSAIKDIKACARGVSKIDTCFGAFDPGRYVAGTTLYPREWSQWGDASWRETHIWVPPVAIYALTLAIVTLAIFRLPSQ
jgi:hypothetical protein